MRIRFIKSIVSIFGTFEPGMAIDTSKAGVSKKIVASWLRNGIAHEVKGHAHGVVNQKTAKAPAKNKNTRKVKGKK